MAQQCQVRYVPRFRHAEVPGMTERLREGINRHSPYDHDGADRGGVPGMTERLREGINRHSLYDHDGAERSEVAA